MENKLTLQELADKTGITLSPEQTEKIRSLLRELANTKDNLLYHTYSPERLSQELTEIDQAISWLEPSTMYTVLLEDGTIKKFQVLAYTGACLIGQATAYIIHNGKFIWVRRHDLQVGNTTINFIESTS